MARKLLLTVLLLLPVTACAETLILKDGTFVEGQILRQTSRTVHIETRFGYRTYARSDIEQIIESVNPLDPSAVDRFDELAAPVKALLNAQAEYRLGRYDRALARLEPYFKNAGNDALRRQVDRLVIDLRARLGEWATVERLLKAKQSTGTPQERIRADAYLAILDANPQRDLRYVGARHVRNFIRDESTLARARQPDALREPDIMRLALEQFCEQMLVEDQLSVVAFADKLDPDVTYHACRRSSGAQAITKHLPYIDDLKRAEATLAKARAILGDYGGAFELDLVRTELNHLLPVVDQMIQDVVELSPARLALSVESRTGRLTSASQAEWKARCNEFIRQAEPARQLLEYMVERVDLFPNGLRDLRKELVAVRGRLGHMIKAVKKARSRTRA